MGLFSFKKKPKPKDDATGPASAPKGMPSLGLPANNPGKAGAAPPAAAVAPAPVAVPVPADENTVSAAAVNIPVETPGAPTTFELPDVQLEVTGFIEAPSAGTGSMTLEVPEGTAGPQKPELSLSDIEPPPPPAPGDPLVISLASLTAPTASAPAVSAPAAAPPAAPAADTTPSISLAA